MKIEKPWGSFEVIVDEPKYKVKRLVIHDGQSISLQYHNHRLESWVVVSGIGEYVLGRTEGSLFPGKTVVIPIRTVHRITAEEELVIIETQVGECEEEDIVRLKDNYGRID